MQFHSSETISSCLIAFSIRVCCEFVCVCVAGQHKILDGHILGGRVVSGRIVGGRVIGGL